MRKITRTLTIALLLTVCACNNDEQTETAVQAVRNYKVAVVVPQEEQERCSALLDWALKNIEEAQRGLDERVAFTLEWKDEYASDLDRWLKQVSMDNSYAAILGPTTSECARIAAMACNSYAKTLVLPIATSVELQRIYGKKDYVWNLTQSDLTECEIMLQGAKQYEQTKVCLIAGTGLYCQSYSDWMAYQATETGLEVGDIRIYNNEEELRAAVRAESKHTDCEERALIFAPASADDAIIFDDELGKIVEEEQTYWIDFPNLLCANSMNSSSLKGKIDKAYYYEGFAPISDPSTGFTTAYISRFGEEPTTGEAQLYDGLCLLAYALTIESDVQKLNDAIKTIVDGREPWTGSWLPTDMGEAMAALKEGRHPDLSGASGDWTFDDNHSAVLYTTYGHWIYLDGEFKTVEYLSLEGQGSSTSTLQVWDWDTQQMQTFSESATELSYDELKERWAVVISTSDTWDNYRHQADALAMYQLLKRHGYDDDHIILINEDNLANNANNVYLGEVRVRIDGEDVRRGADIDYKLSDLSTTDLKDIMLGNEGERLKKVLHSTSNDNVIVFWCGHGNNGKMAWGSNKDIQVEVIKDILSAMSEEGKYRKMLFVVDACYSGSVGKACEGIPGILFLTAANEKEESKADIFDNNLNVYLSNGFTRAFQETIDESSDITLRNLYYILVRRTFGSHASVYNSSMFGNMYRNTLEEFLE